MRQLIAIFVLSILSQVPLWAQVDSLPLDADFAFQNGVYLTLEQLQQNRPAYKWKEVEARLAANRDKYFAQMEFLQPRGLPPIPAEQVYAFVLNDLPYIRVQDETVNERAATFAGLRVRGKISYYTYERREEQLVQMAAYNPLTGRPFREGQVRRDKLVEVKRLLHFPSGKRGEMNRETLLDFMSDDPKMLRTVEELPNAELGEKLYKCVLIYDDRNPVKLPVYR
jgi:hypothetical protein